MKPQNSEEKAWLRLVHTPGIGPAKAWQVYQIVRDSGADITDVFQISRKKTTFSSLSASLMERLEKSNYIAAEKRFNYLKRSSLQLLHPHSTAFSVPKSAGLPPTLTLWGDLQILNQPNVEVLMKSRDTSMNILKIFLKSIADGKIQNKYWCFCPFSKTDWELVESLLKLECGMILGLVSGISRKAISLAHELIDGQMVILTPEPPLKSRGRSFACMEAFYQLFSTYTRKVFLIHMHKGGKTERRIKWIKKAGYQITDFENTINEFEGTKNSLRGLKSPAKVEKPSDDDYVPRL